MQRGFGIILLMAVVLIGAFQLSMVKYYQRDAEEFSQIVLSYQVNNCVDAAVEEMLQSPDLGIDYTKTGYIKVDPQVALDTFVDYFLMSNKMPITEENKDLVKLNHIGAILVAGYDGYFIGTPEKVAYENGDLNAGLWELNLGVKKPYSLVNGPTTYALNMGANSGYSITGNNIGMLYSSPMGITKEETFRYITSMVSSDLAYTLDSVNRAKTYYHHSLYLPTSLTNLSSVNPIEGPTVMVVLQDIDFFSKKPLNSFSIGGSVIQETRMVVGYTRGTTKYYTYADLAPPVAVESIFNSMEEAAEAGYSADIEYLQ